MLRFILHVLEATENGAGRRIQFCESTAWMFECAAVGHAWLDFAGRAWSVCLWQDVREGGRAVTLAHADPTLPPTDPAAWWATSLCRRVMLDRMVTPYLVEVALPDRDTSYSLLVLGRHRVFGLEDERRVSAALRYVAAVERTVLMLEPPAHPTASTRHNLTEREYEVLQLLSEGLLARSIAQRLTVSERTVHKHLGNVYRKLGVHDRLMAVTRAQELGLLRQRGA